MSQPNLNTEAAFNEQLAGEMAKRTARLQDTTIDMAVRLKEAREFMAWSVVHVRGIWLDWEKEANSASRNLLEFRMAFERESKSLVTAGKDMAEFFNSPDYLKAHATLKETLAMLDRFAQLKTNGTLDAFAEFVLKAMR